MELTEIGRSGRPHGVRGELAVRVDEHYADDLMETDVLLIGQAPIPYRVESYTGGGKPRVKLATFDTRESIALLANQPLWLPSDRLSTPPPEEEQTPYDYLIGYYVEAQDYPRLGPIEDILDLPKHFLAEVTHDGRAIYLPLHEDLILEEQADEHVVVMRLPEGLLEL